MFYAYLLCAVFILFVIYLFLNFILYSLMMIVHVLDALYLCCNQLNYYYDNFTGTELRNRFLFLNVYDLYHVNNSAT